MTTLQNRALHFSTPLLLHHRHLPTHLRQQRLNRLLRRYKALGQVDGDVEMHGVAAVEEHAVEALDGFDFIEG